MQNDKPSTTNLNVAALSSQHYTSVAKLIHWLIAGLIIANFILAKLGDRAGHEGQTLQQLALFANHKSLGITILGLVLLRVFWRITHTPPPMPASMSSWQKRLSTISHWGLYFLIVAIPMSGWVMSSASSYGLSWFNLFEIPPLTAQNSALENNAEEVHKTLNNVLFVFVVLHIAASLFHHFIAKDNILRRMSSTPALVIFGLGLAGCLATFTSSMRADAVRIDAPMNPEKPPQEVTARDGNSDMQPSSSNTLATEAWQIDYQNSHIVFNGLQAGAQFSGQWLEWRAAIQFIEQAQEVHIDVIIATSQVTTNDTDRDQTLLTSDWFNTEAFPQARFLLTSAIKVGSDPMLGPKYEGLATLTIKSSTIETPFTFHVNEVAGVKTLTGKARLDRLTFGLGLGEWADTTWIDQYVDVEVEVTTVR